MAEIRTYREKDIQAVSGRQGAGRRAGGFGRGAGGVQW
jgi:hypothetical protein